ncbi:YSC84-related protein [Falsirhodobacter sp. 20TX0035]|uniref:lipid-binding SYLF domain-containing protein n=1 Tax=Falsirhodobacter sp. 20TX0035 TaxID=3022019 RepID=UPI00232E5C87|nr:YSC84-related protein [Falsirhodobacter sp. 20TX0035]MDB6453434.1 YSC84-related protein [Falsirhodobacter sp. 20TX0035]
MDRRAMLVGLGATMGLAACANGVNSTGGSTIDARVDVARDYLYQQYPGTRDLADRSAGVLFMPLITEAGFGVGGAYGRGALRINGATVDYYSAAKASVGFQIGAQQYAHALFFMTPDALAQFRTSSGWVAGADVRYAVPDQGASLGKDTTEITPVVALVYGQSGLIAGATVAGTKYTRIIP